MKKLKKYVIGNWKMNPNTSKEATEIFAHTKKIIKKTKGVHVVECAPFVYLSLFAKKTIPSLALGAQDVSVFEKGSYTGQISVSMLKQYGVSHVILGHSERRAKGETSEEVSQKVQILLKANMIPIVCIGESERDDDGRYLDFLRLEIAQSLKGIKKSHIEKILIAYEPIWAIGATEAMSAYDLHQMVIFIKKTILELFGKEAVGLLTILYGGSVNPYNAGDIVKNGEVQGLLVGRESLHPEDFGKIINAI